MSCILTRCENSQIVKKEENICFVPPYLEISFSGGDGRNFGQGSLDHQYLFILVTK